MPDLYIQNRQNQRMLNTETGKREPGTRNEERGTEIWKRVVSGNLHKNQKWPI